jgi:predicted double-glycine peptidase
VALLLLAGSAAVGHAVRASQPPPLLAVPLISQSTSWTCGAAALMAALVYFGVFDEPESRLDEELGATPEDGTRVVRIADEARRFGLGAEVRTGLSIEELAREVSTGAVVIAALQAWPAEDVADWSSRWEDGHYVVVVGVSRDRIYVMDPSVRTGYAYLGRKEFLTRWHDYDVDGGRRVVWNRLGIVLRGRGGLGRYPAEPVPIQ